jgi:hypothetical protein
MAKKSNGEKDYSHNLIVQAWRFVVLNVKILKTTKHEKH